MDDTTITLGRARAVVIDLLDRAIAAVAARDAEIARLHAELDQRKQANVVHFYERRTAEIMTLTEFLGLMYQDEPDETIARATDTGHSWLKIEGEWVSLDG